jgi:hypothetical protein
LIAELKRNITKETARKAAMCLFPKFFTKAEEMSAFIFKTIQSDSDDDDDDQCDVESSSNFVDLLLCFIVVFKTISPLLTIQQNHI